MGVHEEYMGGRSTANTEHEGCLLWFVQNDNNSDHMYFLAGNVLLPISPLSVCAPCQIVNRVWWPLSDNFFAVLGDSFPNVYLDGRRWKHYFEALLNGENESERQVVEVVEEPLHEITEQAVALMGMKSYRAAGPSGLTSDLLKCAGQTGVVELMRVFQKIMWSRTMPMEWGHSLTVLLYKLLLLLLKEVGNARLGESD